MKLPVCFDMVEYRTVTELPEKALEQLRRLYIGAGWIAPEDRAEFLVPMLKQTQTAVGVFAGDDLIGFGRAVSDGCSDAYIQDVVVDAGYRKRGIGSGIIRHLEQELRRCGVDWIGLVGEPGTENFYSRLKLERRSGYTLWTFPDGKSG